MLYYLLVIFCSLSSNVECSFIYDWLGWSDSKVPNLTYKGVPLIQVPFEELSPEDKFLVEASKIVGFELTDLDACQHRLVMKLKSSCGSLSEEELSKFSVNLLNCQSAVEGRQEYPCQENMSLKECTKAMDAETWNAYHIMNNRARAVCYASRQQQFRALAEITVNKLMSTTHTHIEALSSLQKESTSLKGGTSLTLQEIQKTQQDVLSRQRSLATISTLMGQEIQRSLLAVTDQKQFIADFRKDLATVFNKLQNKIETAEKQVTDSAGSVRTSHTDLIEDMKLISNMAFDILKSIDDSSKRVFENNDAAFDKLKEALDNMKEINLSIGYVLSVVETVKQRSSLISGLVGERGENLEVFLVIAVHLLCLITAMIMCTFLSAPWTTRFILLTASALNGYTSVTKMNNDKHNYPNVGLTEFYFGFIIVAVFDWLTRLVIKCWTNRKPFEHQSRKNYEHVKKEQLNVNGRNVRARSDADLPDSPVNDIDSRNQIINNFRTNETPVFRSKVNSWLSDNGHRLSNLNGYTPNMDDDGRSHVSSVAPSAVSGRSTDARSICTAISKNTGQRCRKKALKLSRYCNVHDR